MDAISLSLAHFSPLTSIPGSPRGQVFCGFGQRICHGVSDLVTISRFGVFSDEFWL
ncbi:hypothetical protein C1H46_034412 [Malus baccata]|uniref:Uncharacterized protein n=1 Tax=Malus baccata TaxID=106549 RepID=A0A540L139_MALBA|nr:hypothetical protein C1H46_034412 [Malus baccata]